MEIDRLAKERNPRCKTDDCGMEVNGSGGVLNKFIQKEHGKGEIFLSTRQMS